MYFESLVLSQLESILRTTSFFCIFKRMHHHYCTILVSNMMDLTDSLVVLELSL